MCPSDREKLARLRIRGRSYDKVKGYELVMSIVRVCIIITTSRHNNVVLGAYHNSSDSEYNVPKPNAKRVRNF